MASSASTPLTEPRVPPSPLPPTPSSHQRKSCAQFLSKSLFFCILLLLLPLFPSEAPDFVNQTSLSKFWELFHLLFVGIAVSYGLFSRRSIQVSLDEPRFSNFENSQSYLSKMFHVAPIFENVDDLSASDERKLSEVSYIKLNSGSVNEFGDFNAPPREQEKLHYSVLKKRYENSHELIDTDNVGHACKSRYNRDGSVVLVAETNRSSSEWMESEAIVDYKPLGLPVRSLRSNLTEPDLRPNLTEPDDVELDSGDESCLSSKSSSSSYENDYERTSEFGDNCCTNLEEKFDEAVISSLSPYQLREKFGKKVMRDRGAGNAVLHPSHFRPPSIDEAQFESHKEPRPLRSTLSQPPPQTSSFSPPLSSTTRTHRKMSSLGDISSKLLHSQQYSMRSLSENSRGGSEDPLIELENSSDFNGSTVSSPHLDQSFASIPKILSRGKSVRTIRANAVTMEEAINQEIKNQVENDNNTREDGMRHGRPSIVNPNARNPNRLSKTTFLGIEKQKEDTESLLTDDGKDQSEREDETIFGNSDEEAASSMAGDSESGAHEVDKKAGEFIAKFREQIHLQRMASADKRLRGGWGSFSSTSSSHFS
ncbi:uncharacterized protein LOC111461136 [Cucurbita moschata]|uniref:Uncharacterized protein LOC111461136 n=1 Tax=Cucurbita moschata TaxID=3662 RepID=A0A6J1HAX3_CUCMO|nr:uncharacterized protein LOC111461136 [Cucurbita moschata]